MSIQNNQNNVNHPSHYAEGRRYEPIDVIQDWNLDFCLGNTVKYISRAGRKSSAAMSDLDKELEDLNKAKFYLDYKIKELYEQKEVINELEEEPHHIELPTYSVVKKD